MKKLVFAIAILIAAGAVFFVKNKKASNGPSLVSTQWTQSKSATTKNPSITQTAAESLSEPLQVTVDMAKVPPQCLIQWQRVAELSIEELIKDLHSSVIKLSPQCAEYESELSFAADIYKNCARSEEHTSELQSH